MNKFIIKYELHGETRNSEDHEYQTFNSEKELEQYLDTSDYPYLTWSNKFWIKKVYIRSTNE